MLTAYQLVECFITKNHLTYLSVDRDPVGTVGNVVENGNQELELPDTPWFRIRGTQ